MFSLRKILVTIISLEVMEFKKLLEGYSLSSSKNYEILQEYVKQLFINAYVKSKKIQNLC